ncbi:hypothetical protein SAMN05444143_104164 [Flavobacterium succinicans]|uniref:Uncharacterized protein n=1 Tax=Flavobacterium succinicans TaxID=29536 RepID=A0A1I4V7N2_9FLAO|nr:hypothetical protein [Flavobacterium succinicans]SFM97212.1 hypothetical protein SAMN05444143_104164 [Flavobacterium succinicans]
MTRKESALQANKASWIDPIAKKKSLKQGRERAYKENRQTIGASFKPETIKRIAEAKFIKANNLLAIHLIEKDIAPTKYKGWMKRLQTPLQYASPERLCNAIDRFISLIEKEESKSLDKQTVRQLVERATAEKPAPAYLKQLRERVRLNNEFNALTNQEKQEAMKRIENKAENKRGH